MTTQPIMRAVIVMAGVTLAAFSNNAVAQGASLEITPPRTAPAGATISVKWSGPNGPGDYVTVVGKDAPPSQYLDYKNTSDGRAPVNPVSLVLPAEPGAYEIRYLRGTPRSVLAAVPYEISAVTATLEGPASVVPGAKFDVAWTGPNNRRDWVTIVAVDAATRAYASYVDAPVGRADGADGRRVATLQAPTQPGRYELRYVQQGTRVIGRRPIEVAATPPAASQLSSGGRAAIGRGSMSAAVTPAATPAAPATNAAPAAPPATLDTGRTRELPMTAGAQQALADAATAAANAAAETYCVTGVASAACATISGPARLPRGSTGDFVVTLRNAPTATTVTTHYPAVGTSVTNRTTVTAEFKFESGEGESQNRTLTSLPTAPVAFGPVSATFTFQAAGTFTVVANVFIRARTMIETVETVVAATGQTSTRTHTSEQVQYWTLPVKKVVTVAGP